MILIHEGVIVRIGTPSDILQSELIQRVYGTKPIIIKHPVHASPQIMLQQGGSTIE